MADPHESPAMAAEDRESPPEEVDALPVLAREAGPAPENRAEAAVSLRTAGPGVQVAAVAATGFVAGAAVVGLVHRRRRHSLASRRTSSRRAPRGGPVGELVQIVGTRSLLVDVHLLGGRN
jgi:hypothetical protein